MAGLSLCYQVQVNKLLLVGNCVLTAKKGMSSENVQVLQNVPQSAGHAVQDGHVIETYDVGATDVNDWEELPDTMQADEAFVHALRDITYNKSVCICPSATISSHRTVQVGRAASQT